jgi:hypothetical protein
VSSGLEGERRLLQEIPVALSDPHGTGKMAPPEYYSVYPLTTDDDWEALKKGIGPFFFIAGRQDVFSNICDFVKTDLGCSSAVLEKNYFDEDFKDIYSYHYSKTLSPPLTSLCQRVHFFSKTLAGREERLSADELLQFIAEAGDKGYLGFVIVRPLDSFRVGRTVLRGPSQKSDDHSHLSVLAHFSANLYGRNLRLLSAPFIEQDNVVTTCAQAAIWMVSRYLHHRFRLPKYLPSKITELATQGYSGGMTVPSPGLSPYQICECFKQMGYYVVMFSQKNMKKEKKDWKPSQIVYPYIESGIPVVALRESNSRHHAITLVGHSSNFKTGPAKASYGKLQSTAGWVNAYFYHDDSQGVYRKIRANDLDRDYDRVIVALPRDVNLTAENIPVPLEHLLFDKGGILKTDLIETGESQKISELPNFLGSKDIVVRTLLCPSNNYKSMLSTRRPKMHSGVETVYSFLNLSKYVWIVELSTEDLWCPAEKKVLGEVIFDCTSNKNTACYIAYHFPGLLKVKGEKDYLVISDDRPYSPHPIGVEDS